MNHRLLFFTSTRDVLRAERECRKADLPVKIIPVPRAISSECGMALRVEEQGYVAAVDILETTGIACREARAER